MTSGEVIKVILAEKGRSWRSPALELGISPQALTNRLNSSMYISNFCQTVEKLGYRVALVPENETCNGIIVDK